MDPNEAIRLYQNYLQKDLKAAIDDNTDIIQGCCQIQETIVQSKIKFEPWKRNIDTLLTKIQLHAYSMNTLSKRIEVNNPISNEVVKVLDISSIYVLLRAMLETYLIFQHIYITPPSTEEKEFRHNVWIHGGIKKRLNKAKTSKPKQYDQQKDKNTINNLELEIKQSKYFKLLKTKQQKGLIKNGDPKLSRHWDTMIAESGINRKIMKDIYFYLSLYAHTDALSIIQLQDRNIIKNRYNLLHGTIIDSSMIISDSIISLFKIIPSTELIYNNFDSKLRTKIELYHSILKSHN